VTSVAEETAPDEFKGKPAFMAPEQLPGGAGVDHRADIFAVGVVLHILTLGRGPFSDVSAWLADSSPLAVEGPLADVIERALAPEPQGRFGSARELLAALRKRVPPLADAQAQLGQFVSGRAPPERPLGAIERAIMSEFDVSEPSLVYAPDPTTHRLWVLESEAHSLDPITSVDGRVLQTSDFPESSPTSPRVQYSRRRADATLPAGLVPSQPARDDAGEFTPIHEQERSKRRLHEAGELTPVQPRVIFDPGEATTVDAPRIDERLDPTPPVLATGMPGVTPMPPPLGTPPPPPLVPPSLARPSLESLAASSLSRPSLEDGDTTREYEEPPLRPLEPFSSSPIEITDVSRRRRSLPRTSLIVLVIAGVTALLVMLTRSRQTLPPDPRLPEQRDPLAPPTLPPSKPARPAPLPAPSGESTASVTVRAVPTPRVRVKPRGGGEGERGIGYLTLDTEPWASVYLGTRRLGTTPFARVAVPSGRVQLTFDLQDRGQRVQRSVDIDPGEVKRLALRLR
jgi:serine/threonine protein kinase